MLRPESEAELADCVAGLDQPVRIAGGGSRGATGPERVLSTAGLRRITLYEPGALTLVARAGTPLAEIDAALAAEGQRLAFEPMDHRGLLGNSGEPTIGGVVAANVSGPRRVQAGACRDFLLGVRFVDGTGRVVKNGGRVMKNVTGYDLVKLLAGSWGTLGVLSEVSLKALPASEVSETLQVSVAGAHQAVKVLSTALGSPFEVTGAAYDPAAGLAMLRLEGFADSVEYRAGRLLDLLRPFGEVSRAGPSEAEWRRIRDVAAFHDRPGDVWRISARPSRAPELAARAEADALVFDWGGGLIWALVPERTDLRARLGAFDGHATLVRAAEETMVKLGRFRVDADPLAALSGNLRQRFDPRALFNPGLMG